MSKWNKINDELSDLKDKYKELSENFSHLSRIAITKEWCYWSAHDSPGYRESRAKDGYFFSHKHGFNEVWVKLSKSPSKPKAKRDTRAKKKR